MLASTYGEDGLITDCPLCRAQIKLGDSKRNKSNIEGIMPTTLGTVWWEAPVDGNEHPSDRCTNDWLRSPRVIRICIIRYCGRYRAITFG